MGETVTLSNRQRGHANALRSETVRVRVEDALANLGGRRGATEFARSEFIRTAVKVARARRMRLWSDNCFPFEVGAEKSLKTLLGEEKRTRHGRTYTGVNDGWVLDIWEATCDYLRSLCLPNIETNIETENEELECSIEEIRRLNDGGPAVIKLVEVGAVSVGVKPHRRLSERLLSAFLEGDERGIMELALEVEELERKQVAV